LAGPAREGCIFMVFQMNYKGTLYKTVLKQTSCWLFAVCLCHGSAAQTGIQTEQMPTISAMRQLSHDYIINSVKELVSLASINSDSVTRNRIGQQILKTRIWVETNPALSDNEKYKWLRGINNLLFDLHTQLKTNKISAEKIVAVINAFSTAMLQSAKGLNIEHLIDLENSVTGNLILSTGSFTDNVGYAAARDRLVLKACKNNPNQILQILDAQGAAISFNRYADSLLIAAAYTNAEAVYNYAASPSALGKKIQSNNHPLMKWIGRLAYMKTGRYYFPFLDELYTGKLSVDAITPLITEDQAENYYKLLVQTRINQVERKKLGVKLVAEQALLTRLKGRVMELYVNSINGLHQIERSSIRFKKLEHLTAVELYYIAVLGADELYTSSFVSGVYPAIVKKLAGSPTDILFERVHQDYCRKFISIAANYNTLQDFLAAMSIEAHSYYMRSFVANLDKSPTLEDAVDVANAFSSIVDTGLQNLLQTEIRKNTSSPLYKALDTLFTAVLKKDNEYIANSIGLEATRDLRFSILKSSNKKVIIRQFFYGDKDGAQIFTAFLNSFNRPGWKISKQKYWTAVTSINGKVCIYANAPLDEKKELDLRAQDSLTSYLQQQNMAPSIIVHRGHSYYANHTITRIDSSTQLVVLGSCGGYQKLAAVFLRAPHAQVIASKQIGKGVINAALLTKIADTLEKGQDIDWPIIWSDMTQTLKGAAKNSFEDYIPPYKNLGLLLLKAFTPKPL
jgi:hypothetical protein